MAYRGRFAPSATGLLHRGSLIAVVASWLCARHEHSAWLLRVENIDPPHEVTGSATAILAALPRFGLVADEPVLRQSPRRDAYDAAFDQLGINGLAFPCGCSRSALAESGVLHRDGRCVTPPHPQRSPAWRVRVPDIEASLTMRCMVRNCRTCVEWPATS